GPGSGFTQRLLTSPDGDIAEDEAVTATGSYSATAPLSSSGPWIMQMVAFRTPNTTGLWVAPRVSVLTFTGTQQFTTNGNVLWSVDGVIGGSGSSGTITSAGLYTPPKSAGTHIVTATTMDGLQAADA